MSTLKVEEDPDGSTIASPIAFPPEVWALVGEQICSRTTLQALVLVSRSLRDIFTPLLHAKCSVLLSNRPVRTLVYGRKLIPNVLRYTKHFAVVFHEFSEAKLHYKKAHNHLFAQFIARILRHMSDLQSFRWLDVSLEASYGLARILKDAVILTALKKCKGLTNVSIRFSSIYLENRQAAGNCSMPFHCFQNLTSLELFNFYAFRDMTQMVRKIANLLYRCPGLKRLGLGMACDFDCDEVPESLIVDDNYDFLEQLCMLYGSESNALPLALETLRLGHGMHLFQSLLSTQNSDFLSRLVDVAELKTLHIFNGFVKYGSDDEALESMEIYWPLLNGCESLHQLSVTRLEPDVTDWLNTKGQSVQELIVTYHYTMYSDDLDEFDRLNLPKLTMISTSEGTVAKRDDDNAWSDTDSSIEDSTNSTDLGIELSQSESRDATSETRDSSEIKLFDSNEPYSLSHPRSYDRSIITVLDRLHDRGARLTRLRICLDFESQWVHFYNNLSRLAALKHLYIHSRSWRGGQYPTKESSLWPNVIKPKEIAYNYAQLIQPKCLHLQNIRIEYWAWRICASNYGDERKELIALDRDEMWSIDLFTIENFPYDAGLPGHQEPGDTEDHSERSSNLNYPASKLIDEVARDLIAKLRESRR